LADELAGLHPRMEMSEKRETFHCKIKVKDFSMMPLIPQDFVSKW
jgi:hypothetical protein